MPFLVKSAAAALIATIALSPVLAQAEGVRSERNISLELANQIAAATVAACQAGGYAVAGAD